MQIHSWARHAVLSYPSGEGRGADGGSFAVDLGLNFISVTVMLHVLWDLNKLSISSAAVFA